MDPSHSLPENPVNRSGLDISYITGTTAQKDPLNVVSTYIQPAIFIAGILSNGATFAVLQRMWMSPLCNIMITALCITDFFCCVFGLENAVLEALFFHGALPRGHWSPTHLAVISMYYLYIMFLCMSSATVVLVSIIRTYTLRQPLKALHQLTPQRVVRCVIAVDLCVFLLFLPVTIYILWQVCHDDTGTVCICEKIDHFLSSAKSLQYYLLFLVVMFGPVAALLNLIYGFKLKRAIKQSTLLSNRLQQLSDVKKRDQTRRTMRVATMFLFILIFNALCILPFSIYKILQVSHIGKDVFGEMDSGIAGFGVAVHLIVAILPSCNFWVYLVVNQYFRKELKEMVCCETNSETAVSPTNSIKVCVLK